LHQDPSIARRLGIANSAAAVSAVLVALLASSAAASPWVVYEPVPDQAKNKHIVLVAGDEEYRSEQALPQLGKILAKRHGFRCTVLFPIDPRTGHINPNYLKNIPGLHMLKTADLMVLFTRFRQLPADQMAPIIAYLRRGKPVIGIRPSVVAFRYPKGSPYRRYSYGSRVKGWEGGFGARVLGQTWVSHHGRHGRQGTRGLITEQGEDHPITNGIADGDICGPTDVYTVSRPMGDRTPLVLGQVLETTDCDAKPVKGTKNDPMMPIAWTHPYQVDEGAPGRAFMTTIGAADDFKSAGLRRLVVNAAHHLLNLDVPEKADVRTIGHYDPSPFGFGKFPKKRTPDHFALPSDNR
jgi:hypothetical protein